MENWGLITYRETDLLYNPTRDQISNKRRVSLVISHELAHQWVYLLKIYEIGVETGFKFSFIYYLVRKSCKPIMVERPMVLYSPHIS